MRTPVASFLIRLKSSSQSGNLIQQEYKSSYGTRNLISEILSNSHFEDLGAGNLSVTVFWYFPKWEVPLYFIKVSVGEELDNLYQVPQREA